MMASGRVSGALWLGLLCAVAGCTTASLQDAAPTSLAEAPTPTPSPADPAPPVDAVAIAGQQPAGPVNQGEFPNLNIAPVRHGDQVKPAAENADIAKLTRQRQTLAAGAAATTNAAALAEAERLRLLGATHADQALQEIERQ